MDEFGVVVIGSMPVALQLGQPFRHPIEMRRPGADREAQVG